MRARTRTHIQGRVNALQALSGTGALRVGAGFLARFMKVGVSVFV
jgi:aspartate/tyrosine/aromatic aminotransferase